MIHAHVAAARNLKSATGDNMNSRPNCQARIRGDQYHCDRCGLVWDISDIDPPECQTVFNVGTPGHVDHGKSDPEIEKKEMIKMREIFKK